MIAFSVTGRDRAMVVTHHQIQDLSERAGRDVSAELVKLSERTFEAKTFGDLMRQLGSLLKVRA